MAAPELFSITKFDCIHFDEIASWSFSTHPEINDGRIWLEATCRIGRYGDLLGGEFKELWNIVEYRK